MDNLITHLFTKVNWLKVHLYLALLVGFLFALIGLSGSINVYHEQIDALLNPALTIEAVLRIKTLNGYEITYENWASFIYRFTLYAIPGFIKS